jgi:6-pyruvoyltetrahydropterin/6-carboxytetrahydropterin synthase
MTWTIDKQFDFCFGHRVWSQNLDTKYSLDGCMACRHLHGHQGKLKLFLSSKSLERGMVTDFKHTNIFKKWVDDTLDHKFIMDINDPLMKHECPELFDSSGQIIWELLIEDENYMFYRPDYQTIDDNLDLRNPEHRAVSEKYEGLIFVDFVPTSENLCAWWARVANKMLEDLPCTVSAIEYWETPKSHCRFS